MGSAQKRKSTIWVLGLTVFVAVGVLYLTFTADQTQPKAKTIHVIHFDPTYADQITTRENEILDLVLNGGTTNGTIIRQINSSIMENQNIIDELAAMTHEDSESEEFKLQVIEYAYDTNAFLGTLADGIEDGTGDYQDTEDRLDLYDEITNKAAMYKFEPK